jgi:RND family efflux transporter MFP subunit
LQAKKLFRQWVFGLRFLCKAAAVNQSFQLKIDLTGLSARLLEAQELIPRARIVARTIADLVPGTAVNAYVLLSLDGAEVWVPKATVGEASVQAENIPVNSGTLGELSAQNEVLLLRGKDLLREKYAHLDIRRTLLSLAYLPLLKGEMLAGAIEILSFEKEITEEQLSALSPVADVSAAALMAAQGYENERHDALTSISRLTQLYDLEKVFASTLEMDELLPIIGSKFCEVMECEGVNLWLLQPDETLELMHQAGLDPTTQMGSRQKPGEGVAGDVSDNGEAVLIDQENDERLTKRNTGVSQGGVASLLVVPIMDKESLVGVVEAVNKIDGTPFHEDDLFALTSLTETASSALHNASLLLAERKLEILEALVKVSQEIASTLNLDRVLHTVVNAPQAVIPFERAAIALEERGKLRLSAVSGTREIRPGDPQFKPLNDLLQWAAPLFQKEVWIRQHGDDVDDAREETRAKFHRYFADTGYRSFYALPLADDQGQTGILCFESSDPDFLSPAHQEVIKIVAGQATVAVRNAQLYREVPLIGLLEPMLEKKRKFLSMEKSRRRIAIGVTAAAVSFLVVCPIPMRLTGNVMVAPEHKAEVTAFLEGVVKKVYVREGDALRAGSILADLEDWDYRAALAAAQAKYETAKLEMNRALASNDASEAGIQRAQVDFWGAELRRSQERLEHTHLRSPIEGVVATPHVENLLGQHLAVGDNFAEILDTSKMVLDVAVEEGDLPYLRAGERASIKLEAFPVRTFKGDVTVVSLQSQAEDDHRVYYARVTVPNPGADMRSGMQGRGKIMAGWHTAGFVLLRGPASWFYSKLWSWLGW